MVNNKIWISLITTLLKKDITFEIINNVLSFEEMPDGVKGLWLWFGEIRVAEDGDKKAGDMLILENFEFDKNNKLVIYSRGN